MLVFYYLAITISLYTYGIFVYLLSVGSEVLHKLNSFIGFITIIIIITIIYYRIIIIITIISIGDALTILDITAEDGLAVIARLATKASVWVTGGLKPASFDALTALVRITVDGLAVIARLATSAKVCWVTCGLQPASFDALTALVRIAVDGLAVIARLAVIRHQTGGITGGLQPALMGRRSGCSVEKSEGSDDDLHVFSGVGDNSCCC